MNSVDFANPPLYTPCRKWAKAHFFVVVIVLCHTSTRNFKLFDLDRVREIIQKVVSAESMELVDVELKGEFKHRILRIYIDKAVGITHSDCELISKQLGTVLDVENLITTSYTLEVSSPGLTRKLTKEADFIRYVGRLVKVQTREPIQGLRSFRGALLGFQEGQVLIATKDESPVRIPLALIAKAHLDFDF
jgi:ribosome maturation factor RimP